MHHPISTLCRAARLAPTPKPLARTSITGNPIGSRRVWARIAALTTVHAAQVITAPAPVDYAKMTVKALRALATDRKIKGRSKARRKADLVALLAKS